MGEAGRIRVGVAGIDHDHGLVLAARLRQAGASIVAYDTHTRRDALVMRLLGPAARPRSIDAIVGGPDVDLVVTATIPSDRAGIAVRALRAGKHVVADKPGVTTPEDLGGDRRGGGRERPPLVGRVRGALREPGGGRGVRAGAARRRGSGGLGPRARTPPHGSGGSTRMVLGTRVDRGDPRRHRLAPGRPVPRRHRRRRGRGDRRRGRQRVQPPPPPDGGHRIDGPQRRGALGTHRVDYLSPAGLRTWGDGRLMIVGTDGTLEVRTNVDVAGRRGNQHLIVVDQKGVRRVGCRSRRVDWARRLLDDVRTGERHVPVPRHVRAVCDLTLRARAAATPWPEPVDAERLP